MSGLKVNTIGIHRVGARRTDSGWSTFDSICGTNFLAKTDKEAETKTYVRILSITLP